MPSRQSFIHKILQLILTTPVILKCRNPKLNENGGGGGDDLTGGRIENERPSAEELIEEMNAKMAGDEEGDGEEGLLDAKSLSLSLSYSMQRVLILLFTSPFLDIQRTFFLKKKKLKKTFKNELEDRQSPCRNILSASIVRI